jgi:hypothetical protein
MSYLVHYRNIEVTCDTLDEVDALAERADRARKSPVDLQFRARTPETNGQTPTVQQLVAGFKARPKKALKAIVSSGGHITDTELCRILKAKNNMALAGILSPVYRQARDQGIQPDTFLQRQSHVNEQNEKITEYIIPPDALEKVREGLNA